MKNFQKITVLASTVLLSTVFSPKAHAEGENIYNYKGIEEIQELKNENIKSEEESEKSLVQEEKAENIEENVEAPSQDLEIEEEETEAETKLENAQVKEGSYFFTRESLENTEESTSTEDSKLEEGIIPVKSRSVEEGTYTFSRKDDTFTDIYIYEKVDLDKGFIAKDPSYKYKKVNTSAKSSLKEVEKSSDGRYVLKTDGNKNYYYDNGVLMKNKDTVLNGKFYKLASDGTANVARNSWVNVNGVKYYANENGYTQIGLKKIGNTTYHFEDNGRLTSNKTVYRNQTFYKINNKGIASAIRNQWVTYEGKTYYINQRAGKANGITSVSGKQYYFSKGALKTNIPVLYTGDKFYNVDSRGIVKTYTNTWVNYKGNEFYANENGWRCEGITHINGEVYNLTQNGKGKNYYAYSEKDNATYYFDDRGVGTIVSTGKPDKDLDVMIGWMYDGMNNNMTYDMGAGRTSKYASDCSSAVFRAMIYGGFRKEGSFIGNTETLFALGRAGKVLKEITENEIRYGDVFVAGTPGQSLGAGGHTGFILDKNTIIHSNGRDDGINVTVRKGRMGDASGFPIRYYRLVGGKTRN